MTPEEILTIISVEQIDALVLARMVPEGKKRAMLIEVIEKAYEAGYRKGQRRGAQLLRNAVVARLEAASHSEGVG